MGQNSLLGLGKSVLKSKGDCILSQGDTSDSLFFVDSGLIKAFYTTSDGREFIKSFIQKGDVVGSLSSCVLGKPSPFTLTCLEDSSLRQICFSELTKITQENALASQEIIAVLVNLLIKKEQREYEFLCLSAAERYRLLCETSPHILKQVKLQDLARFLGITPVALSRIRSNEHK